MSVCGVSVCGVSVCGVSVCGVNVWVFICDLCGVLCVFVILVVFI